MIWKSPYSEAELQQAVKLGPREIHECQQHTISPLPHADVDCAPSEVQVEGSRLTRALFIRSRGGPPPIDPLPYELARTSHENLLVAVGPFHCMQTQRKSSAVKWHRLQPVILVFAPVEMHAD